MERDSTIETGRDLLPLITELLPLCTDMRFGQMMMTLDVLAQDMYEQNLGCIEDDDLAAVIERFRQDLTRREESVV